MEIAILLIILLAGTIITFASGDKYASKMALLFSIIAAVCSVLLTVQYHSMGYEYSLQWLDSPNLTFSLKLDGLSLIMILLNSILLPIIILTSHSYRIKYEKVFYSLVLFMSLAMTGAFLSNDALLYYVFWEASLIPIYFIIVIWGNGEKESRVRSAMTFFMYTFAGSLFMLASIIYMYFKTGSFQLSAFYQANLSHTEQIWIFLGFFLAYAIKIPIFPFHTWQASVYQKAPLVGTLMLGALMSKMGLYSVIRWQLPIAPYAIHYFQNAILILAIIGVLYGAIIALKQTNLKRLFAYASLSHVGFIAAGIYSLTFDGLLGAIILIVAHAVSVVGLFLSAEIIHRRFGTFEIAQMGGIKSQAPKFALAFLTIVFASITLPLTFNFVGEFTIMFGVYQVNLWYVIAIGCSMFLSAFFMLRMFQYVMLGKTNKQIFKDITFNEGFIFVILIVTILFFGIYSKPITHLVSNSLNEILFYVNR